MARDEDPTEQRVFIHNVLMQGPQGVGKSRLVHSFAHPSIPFPASTNTSMSAEYASRDVYVDDCKVCIHVCDLSGHPGASLANDMSRVFPYAAAAMLVYDITDRASFSQMQLYLDELESRGSPRRIPTMLLGNKGDLANQRQVTSEEGGGVC